MIAVMVLVMIVFDDSSDRHHLFCHCSTSALPLFREERKIGRKEGRKEGGWEGIF